MKSDALQQPRSAEDTNPVKGKTLLEIVDMFPPWFVIALAKDHDENRALTYKEISERSGVCLRTICRLAGETTWAEHDIDVVSRVIDACGFGPDTWDGWKAYILRSIKRQRPFRHLHRRKRRLKKLVAMLRLTAGKHPEPSGAPSGPAQQPQGPIPAAEEGNGSGSQSN